MLRIGIAASKVAKNSLLTYNLIVILISCLLSLIIFLIGGFSILVIVFLVSLVLHFQTSWVHMFKICLIVLASVVGILNIVAILKNVQLSKNKI